MIDALYIAADSPLHRLPAGLKLAAIPVLAALLFALPGWPVAAVGLAIVLALLPVSGVPPRRAAKQLRPAIAVIAVLFLVQLWFTDVAAAAGAALRFLALILAATLLTMTTRATALIEALEALFRRLAWTGLSPERLSLAIALTLRFIPVLGQVVEEVREAQAARGRDRSIVALAVPVLVRLLKTADEVAEAIDARS
ncbi:energy-coupling factor transporter transmembrane component T family protein [Mangrovicella endophytica]|uniref:energy-coupling factor transporter transmembrane component T family protein n=1 Tax=Mangrovicella endophytica TaxID=2066697 RepID=UPI000C9EB003|nr:energy-coupling factor transporter transmembrane protein EcfT [Mangrovicella endophytica]